MEVADDEEGSTGSDGRRLVLVEYFLHGDIVMIFGVRADWERPALVSHRLDHSGLFRFVKANFGGRQRVRDFLNLELDDLWHFYDTLVSPIGEWTDPDDIVYLVPHGLLHYLPLHALRVGDRYLIERNAVVYGPSSAALRHWVGGRRTVLAADGWRAVVFGDSRDDLPAAHAEAMAMASAFGVTPVLGAEVTRERVMADIAGADIVHFAGHADFNFAQALESGLHLADGDVLTAAEVFGLPGLSAYLVALSGCETGVNDNRPGDELIGLTRAFLYAGASSVLVSLWEVADGSTAELMTRFYVYLRDDPGLWKVDALRRAMLDVKAVSRWASFYHWAPFVLVGDWR